MAGGCFDARQWLRGGGENPASECLDRRITQAIISDDELIVVGAQFGGRDWTNQTAGCEVRFNQRQRSKGDAQAVDGSLQLKVNVIQLKVSKRRRA